MGKMEICNHNPILAKMGYLAAHDEAERRMKKGQKQKQCPTCKLWFFRDELQNTQQIRYGRWSGIRMSATKYQDSSHSVLG